MFTSASRENRDTRPRNRPLIDARLDDAAIGCRVGLLPVAVLDDGPDLWHPFGADLKVGGLFGGVGDRIPHAAESLGLGHWASLVGFEKAVDACSFSIEPAHLSPML